MNTLFNWMVCSMAIVTGHMNQGQANKAIDQVTNNQRDVAESHMSMRDAFLCDECTWSQVELKCICTRQVQHDAGCECLGCKNGGDCVQSLFQ